MLNTFAALAQTMPGMPPGSWWLAPVILFLLGTLAVVDALTARVPDPLIFPSLLFVTVVQGFLASWPFAGRALLVGLGAGFGIFLANEIWFRLSKRDALGMGDAKWTILAVTGFGIMPMVIAWVLGAWLAIGWMGAAHLAKLPAKRVHFAPFLFVGLLVGIYWLRLR